MHDVAHGREYEIGVAGELMERVRSILSGTDEACNPELQRWAADTLAHMPNDASSDDVLVQAITDNLVNILSCDDASWDTTMAAFTKGLRCLEQAFQGEA